MDYRASKKLEKVLMAAAGLCLVIGYFANLVAFPLLTLALIVADYVQTRKFYRCPHCRARFDMRKEPPTRCPACEKEL